jgi:hypothetical protein
VPLSTKLVSTLGVLLVVGGLLLGAWNKLRTGDHPATVVIVGQHHQTIPGTHWLMPGLVAILVIAIAVSVLVLSRGKRHIH